MSAPDIWSTFLTHSTPVERAVVPMRPADAPGLRAAKDAAFVCELSSQAIISVLGPDAEAFLHGQLSNDVRGLATARAQLAAYNTAKGRMLATVLLWRVPEGLRILCPASVADGLLRRLSMFVLRAKVRISNVSARTVRIGIGGPSGRQALAAAGLPVPASDYDLAWGAGGVSDATVIGLPGNRWLVLHDDPESAIRTWTALRASAVVATDAPWHWLGVRTGIAQIEALTQDKFVPQMLNLELVGGISFTKGCYPGQEIVARTQYRGEIKRRMLLAHLDADTAPGLGQEVVAVGAGQSVGSIVASAPSPEGGYDVLACLHLELAHGADLHLGRSDGPRLLLQPLPYSLPQAV